MKQLTFNDWLQIKQNTVEKNNESKKMNYPSKIFLDIYDSIKEITDFHEFAQKVCELTGKFIFCLNSSFSVYQENNGFLEPCDQFLSIRHAVCLTGNKSDTYSVDFLWFDNKEVYSIPIEIYGKVKRSFYAPEANEKIKVSVKKWVKKNKIILPFVCLQKNTDELLKITYPYLYPLYEDLLKEKGITIDRELIAPLFLMAPEFEQLIKAGYRGFLDNYFDQLLNKNYSFLVKQNLTAILNRIIQPATKIKKIFKVDKNIYTLLKDEKELKKWDYYRKLCSRRALSDDALSLIYEANYSDKELNLIYCILGAKYQDNKVFSFESLQNYLRRLDMYEAIPAFEALQILKDYLQNCNILEMKPKIDGDSLKREHDISSRLVREKRDSILAEKMIPACEHMKRYDYMEDIYFVRGIRSYDDLIDEAKQQHNCVAGYAKSIVSKKSMIFVMRECKNPDKSLITIELSPDGKTIRQKYLAYNHQIRNAAQTDFIKRWCKYCQTR